MLGDVYLYDFLKLKPVTLFLHEPKFSFIKIFVGYLLHDILIRSGL